VSRLAKAADKRIAVACFGAGWVTTHRHIPTMRRHGGFEVAAIVDRRPERAKEAAERLGIPRHAGAESVEELDFQEEIDAVTCGTAPFAHHRVVGGALRAGKHVLTEKPFTMTLEEGEELVALARERERTLAVVHNFQFARSVLRLRRWMQEGKIGRLRAVWALQLSNPARRLPTWFDELPFGLFYDESPHLIYMARALAGGDLDPVSVTVHPSTRGLVNTPAQIDAQMRSGEVPVSIQMNFEAPVSEWHVAAIGDRGIGTVDLFRDIAVYTPNDGDHGALEVLRSSASSSWHHWRGYAGSGLKHLRGTLRYGNDEVFRRFHQAVLTRTVPPAIDGTDALAVLKIQHWILEAGQDRRRIPV
jgi:scyllo-inositol 2-dehydrogenase (NADP+)